MLSKIDKKLYEYLGDKTLSFGCLIQHFTDGTYGKFIRHHHDDMDVDILSQDGKRIYSPDASDIRKYIIGHEPTLTDFHKWVTSNVDTCGNRIFTFSHLSGNIIISYSGWRAKMSFIQQILYDSSLPLMQQSDTTKEAIIKLIEEYGNN